MLYSVSTYLCNLVSPVAGGDLCAACGAVRGAAAGGQQGVGRGGMGCGGGGVHCNPAEF